MKAAQINEYGGKEVLKTVEDAPKPTPAKGEILVAVHAAAVNPFDWKVREGQARQMAELSFPAILGGDFAGSVAGLGEGVNGVQIGDEIYGQANALGGHGSFAEFTPVKATSVAPKPKNVDFSQAASLPLTGVSAYQALVEHIGLKPGQKILIHGGAGGIGSYAIPLAKHLGAYVATTVGTDDMEYVKNLGADEVIDYKNQDFTTLIHDYDAVYDLVGSETNKKSYQVLKPGGVLVSMLEQADESLVNQYNVKAISQFTRVTTERLNELTKLVEQGIIQAKVDKTYSLDGAAEALEAVHGGHQGKIVIVMS